MLKLTSVVCLKTVLTFSIKLRYDLIVHDVSCIVCMYEHFSKKKIFLNHL